jgi:hypothetical protein
VLLPLPPLLLAPLPPLSFPFGLLFPLLPLLLPEEGGGECEEDGLAELLPLLVLRPPLLFLAYAAMFIMLPTKRMLAVIKDNATNNNANVTRILV